jgi:hypothetical protein
MTTSPFDASLLQQLEAQRAELEKLRLSLRQERYGCRCSPSGCCSHHAIAWNALLEAERALWEGIRGLEASAYQNGDGPRPGWWDSDDDEATVETMLEDVSIERDGEVRS